MTAQTNGNFWFESVPTAVATPIIVPLPRHLINISIVIVTDIAGTGTVKVTAKVADSPDVPMALPDIDVATPKHDLLDTGSFSELTFAPTIATAATYTVFIQATRQ